MHDGDGNSGEQDFDFGQFRNGTLEAIAARRSVRRFSQRPLPEGSLQVLLNATNRTPSGFNLQPWYFIVVDDPGVKELLRHVAMGQAQISDAPATVVFAADPLAWRKCYPRVLKLGRESGAMTQRHIDFYRKNVRLLFQTGPLGLFGLAKRLFVPIRRLREPTPTALVSREDAVHYVRSQTMLAAATFMIAAQSMGLMTSPMEGFDEYRAKRLLGLPKRMTIPLLVSVGYALEIDEQSPQSVRLPLEQKVSFNQFNNE